MARDGGKFPAVPKTWDAGFAIGESSGRGDCEEIMNGKRYSPGLAKFCRRGMKKSKIAPTKSVGTAPGLTVCGKIVRIRKVFVAWVEKRAYIRKCRTLFCGADLILPREERDRLFSS
jgi:hypothetical protein